MAGMNGSDARTVVAVISAGIMGSAMAGTWRPRAWTRG